VEPNHPLLSVRRQCELLGLNRSTLYYELATARYVLAWRLSNTLDSSFCLDALRQALEWGKPRIFNTELPKEVNI
jgi:hypothetical protein